MKRTLLVAIALLALSTVNAQYYYIMGSGQNPKGLNTDAEYPSGGGQPAGWTSILAGPQASPAWSGAAVIPFSFTFNGNVYTSLKASSSGVLTFTTAASAVPSETNTSLPAAEIPDNSVCIWGLKSANAGDEIYTKTFGVAPNRQFWIQYNSYSEAGLGTGYTYWAIALEETTNKIYIVDQRASSTTTTLTLGVQINSTTAVQVTGSPSITVKAGISADPIDNYYYDFTPGVRPAFDMGVTALTMPKDLAIGQAPFAISGTVTNYGATTINSFNIAYSVNGGAAVTGNITGVNIPTNTSYNFTHPTTWTPSAPGAFALDVMTVDMNGGNADLVTTNDKMSTTTTVWEAFTPRRALHEIFTSSTCPPCNPGNKQMHTVIGTNLGKFSVIKYQYYFPGNGDPYFTPEAYNRGTYYGGVNSIPDLFVDGGKGWRGNPNSYVAANFDQVIAKPSFCEITVSHTMTGRKMDVTATVKPLVDMPAGTYKIRMAIVEKSTFQNVKNNGETDFYWVMKKMLPNEAGTAFTFPAKNLTSTINQSYTFPGSYKLSANARPNASAAPTGSNYGGINLATENSVEDFGNLAVVVFIQNETTKDVLQSAWSSQDWAANTDNKLSNVPSLSIYPNPASKYFNIDMGNATLINDLEVTVTDITGKTIATKTFSGESNNDLMMDCSNFTKGIYMVQMRNGSQTSVQKLMIQ